MAKKVSRDLSGVYLKLERAEHHIECCAAQLEAFLKHDPAPFGFRTKIRPRAAQAIEYALYAVVKEVPPRELALPIGDAVQNIRSALEYLAYELASQRARKAGKTGFPIYTDECGFKVNGAKRIESIRGDERTLIENVQPYAANPIPDNDPLEILRKLSNLDKHHLLVPMIASVSNRDTWIGSDNADIDWTFYERGPVVDGAKIVGFVASPKDPSLDMYVQPESGLQVQLGGTGARGFDIGALELLQMLHHYVRQTVVGMWFEYGYMPKTWAELEGA